MEHSISRGFIVFDIQGYLNNNKASKGRKIMIRYLTHSITFLLFMLVVNHWYRYLNYLPFAFMLGFWVVCSFIIIRVENSKW